MTRDHLDTSTPITRLILVRHGQTACNVADIWHGWDDCVLTETGLTQAKAAGERLASEPITAVYCSDMPRAVQTARAIAGYHNLQPITTPDLRERGAGEFEGVPMAEVIARNPHIWEERDADFWNWSPPGGETFTQLLERALGAVHRIHAQHPGETVVAVSHMSTLRAMTSRLGGIEILDTFQLDFPSTGVTILRLTGDAVEVEVLNDGAHLAR